MTNQLISEMRIMLYSHTEQVSQTMTSIYESAYEDGATDAYQKCLELLSKHSNQNAQINAPEMSPTNFANLVKKQNVDNVGYSQTNALDNDISIDNVV